MAVIPHKRVPSFVSRFGPYRRNQSTGATGKRTTASKLKRKLNKGRQ
ncbi:hypothetical protein COLO4_32654 [Corchorus olitorius]|uniref:Uncharacterized protein n=1 Tax=Corchorus olitorius TaxID=93759 RepID=A0A1R3GZ08_9ROSI|nr:hypothetical protein COLO4_32654 [Corchorus olitorius]